MRPPAPDAFVWKLLDLHTSLLRVSRGRLGGRLGRLRFLVLHHVGARTGADRQDTLLYRAHGEDIVIVASKGGGVRNPAWLHNLRAHPDVLVDLPGGGPPVAVRAREVDGPEREELWRFMVAMWPFYATYQRNTDRLIPVVVLERRPPPS
jgi:deazaflavin-dependent oxidoreductase (nitroreductase family)